MLNAFELALEFPLANPLVSFTLTGAQLLRLFEVALLE